MNVRAAIFITVLAALFFSLIAAIVMGRTIPGDTSSLLYLSRLAHSPTGQWLTPLAKILGMAGNWQALIPIGFLILHFVWRKILPLRFFGLYALACAGSGALILMTKYLLNRPRPDFVPALEQAPFASFPSGHSMYALVAYGFLAAVLPRCVPLSATVRFLFLCAAVISPILCGLSRVYLGTHYLSDVIGGYLLGIPYLILIIALSGRLLPARKSGAGEIDAAAKVTV